MTLRRQTIESAEPDNRLTWAILLAKWSEFARASVAFPDDAEGRRWSDAVPSIIAIQALTHALAEIDTLPDDEIWLAIDRADLTLHQHARQLHQSWADTDLPLGIADLLDDARLALDAARHLGVEIRTTTDELTVSTTLITILLTLGNHRPPPAIIRAAPPGTILFKAEPLAFISAFPGIDDAIDALAAEHPDATVELERTPPLAPLSRWTPPRQVYREADPQTGRVVADLVAPFLTALPPGRPLLLNLLEDATPTQALTNHDAERWERQQRAAFADQRPPVRFQHPAEP